MTEAIASLADLTPIGGVLVIASLLAVGITQIAKQQSWTKARTQFVAAGVAGILGLLAAIVLGLITGIPDSIVQVVSSILLSIAAVLVLARALYGVLGYVIPDGKPATDGPTTIHISTSPGTSASGIAQALDESSTLEHGRRADRDGTSDGRDTPVGG